MASVRIRERTSKLHDLPQYNTDQEFTHLFEPQYPFWWNKRLLMNYFMTLIENTFWNCYICMIVLVAVLLVTTNVKHAWFNLGYNISYAIHVLAIAYNAYANRENHKISWKKILGLVVDLLSFTHYIYPEGEYKFICYFIRFHRPFQYLWTLTNYNLKGSIIGTSLKYCYIFMVVRVVWALLWLLIDNIEDIQAASSKYQPNPFDPAQIANRVDLDKTTPSLFISALYVVDKMFIPIGPSLIPNNDMERVTCMLVMVTGCLVVAGAAVASMSLVISMYMRPEETFRARYKLIIKEMKETRVPQSQREKVQTFYRMYWHKQKAVSATQLLQIFPPTLAATIQCDIYFEATQKSRILQDLSYEFLAEVAKKMETRLFIPGDAILKRSSSKSSIIYITYGDIEMVTAEDDSTPILRMSRGTILTPCGACTPAGLGKAHVEVRAATFCLAQVLEATDLWKVAVKYGRDTKQSDIIYDAFVNHMEMVQRHYNSKVQEVASHKSSILPFKKCLMALKEARDANGELLLARTDVFLEIAGCYIMRNRADSSLTDESDDICLRSTFPCILQPDSSLQLAWNLFIAGLIVTVCFVHPYYLVFKKTVPIDFRFFDYVVTVIFAIDILVHLSTGANVEEGIPISFAQTSSQQMRSHWFVLDVLATLPIFEFIGNGHFGGINKLLRLHKVFRVLKGLEDKCVYRSNVLRFFSFTLLQFIACYLVASLQQGFMCFYFGYCQVTNYTHSPYWDQKPLNDETVENRLTFSLYWAISMIMFTSHMESWGTSSIHTVIYTMFVLEVCVVLRIFMEGVYSATIMVTTSLREDYDATISMVKNCFVKNDLDPVLRQRFITYLQLCWYTDKAYAMANKRSIFFDLPSHVYQDIVASHRLKYLHAIPFMKFLNLEDQKLVSSQARLFYTSPNEILINTGDFSNEMYVISQGVCEILDPETKGQVGLLRAKCHFGVGVCLFRIPAYYTIRAVTHVQVFSVSLKSLSQPIEASFLKDILEDIKKESLFRTVKLRREQFISYFPPDPTPNTEKFRLPRKHEMDYEYLQPFYRLGFFSVLRYVFPRYTIRPDGPYLIRYEWFRSACAFACAMIYPSYTYLHIEWPALYYITWFLDITAYLDVMQRMLIGYFNEDGILVYHPASTAAHYAKGAMIVDLIGCLPWEGLQDTRIIGSQYLVTRTEQFLMLGRLLQLYRLQSIMLVLDDYFERKDILLVIRAIPFFMVLVNVATCLLVFYSAKIYYSKEDSYYYLIKPINNTAGGSWLTHFGNQFRYNMTGSLWNLHLTAFFWVVYETTTTGYNCFKPSNFKIMNLLFIVMLTGAMIITYFSVRIISARASVNKPLAEFQEHMKDMIMWMKKEKLNPNLQKEVFEHYEYNWDKMGGIDYNSVFKLCDQITLRTDAILHVYGPTFSKCPILSSVEVSVLRMMGRASHSMHFLRGMTIIELDDVVSDIYFVDYGSIQARYNVDDVEVVDTLLRGSMFGNLENKASSTVRCPVSFVSTSRVHLLRITTKIFHKIVNDFPDILDEMEKHKADTQKPFYIKGGESQESSYILRENSPSAAIASRSRRNFIKYIYFKDSVVQTYLILVSLLCIYLDVYNVGFQNNSVALIIALYSLDVAFYLKIALYVAMPFIGGYSHVREILRNKRDHYMKSDLKYDVISCLPLEIFSLFSKNNMWFLFSWFRLNRLFRIVTVYSCLKRYREKITVNFGLVTIWAVTIWFSLSVHTISCVWYYIGISNERNEPHSSWIYKDDGTSWCDNEYICSLYFIVTTFTQNGVGDILPKKQSEVVFVCILQLIATMVFMIYVGEFSNIIQYKSFRSFSFYSKYLELQVFLKNNRVSRNLVAQVNRYSLHLWRESRGVQSPHFLQTAPHALRLTIMSDAYMGHIRLHHIFKECEPAFLRQLVGCFQVYTYDENMFVVKACEITNSMYFIHRGKVMDLSDENNFVSTIYSVGTSFGLAQGLKHNIPFTESFRTITKAQVLTLRLDDWLALLKHFPRSAATIASHDQNTSTDGGGGGPGGYTEPRSSDGYVRRMNRRITELVDRSTQPSLDDITSDTLSSESLQVPAADVPIVGHAVPPPGPSPQTVGPIDFTDRRRESQTTDKDFIAKEKPAQTDLDAPLPLAGTSRRPNDSRPRRKSTFNPTDKYKDTTAKTEPRAPSLPAEASRLPNDNHRLESRPYPSEENAASETELAEMKLDATLTVPGISLRDTPGSATKDTTAETELAETKLYAPSLLAGTSSESTDRRPAKTKLADRELDSPSLPAETSRDNSRRRRLYPSEEDAAAETELAETKLDATIPVAGSSLRDIPDSVAKVANTETELAETKLDTPHSQNTTAETELANTKLDAPSSFAETSHWPLDNRRDTYINDLPYPSKEDTTAEAELAETKLSMAPRTSGPKAGIASSSTSEYKAAPNVSSFDPSSSGSTMSAKSKTSFLKRVAGAVKKIIPTRTSGGSSEMSISSSVDNERAPDEEYIAELEREIGRLSQSSNISLMNLRNDPEPTEDIKQEAVDITTAPDDEDLHLATEASMMKQQNVSSAARQKRKSVRVRYEDDPPNPEERTVFDSDELQMHRSEDTSNTSEKDSSSSSSNTKNNKRKKQ